MRGESMTGPFRDHFVVSRETARGKERFTLDLPNSGEVPEDNAMLFEVSVSYLKSHPEVRAVRFMIADEGRFLDFDPDFTKPKPKRRRHAVRGAMKT